MTPQDVLFSRTKQRLIGVLFSVPAGRGFSYAEILRRTGGGAGAIHRELKQFEAAGLVVRSPSPEALYSSNTNHPVYSELRALARKLLTQSGNESRELPASFLQSLAKKYLWWTDPKDALKQRERLVAQVMNMGTFEDARAVEKALGKERLRRVIKNAAPGHFDDRSWVYWHYRLGLASPGRVPPRPQRRFS